MAPTETPRQLKSSKVDDKPETAQNPSTDASTVGHLQQTVSGSNKLTDPATEEIVQRATSSSWDDLPVKIFEPVPFVSERKE